MKKQSNKLITVPSHTEVPTSHPDLVKLVDREGNWTHYKHVPTGRFLPAVNHIITNGYNRGKRFHDYLLSVNKEEAKRALETAGERGTRVHEAFRDLVNGVEVRIDSKYPSESSSGRFEPLTNEEWDFISCGVRWLAMADLQVNAQDIGVFSLVHGYAGTVDFLGMVKNVLSMPDWKTSTRIWDEYKLQTAAYYTALLEMQDPRYITPDRTGIVRFAPGRESGYEEKWWDAAETREHFDVFLGSKKIYELNKPAKGDDPDIEEIPTSFKVKVPQLVVDKPKRKSRSAKNGKEKNVGKTNE